MDAESEGLQRHSSIAIGPAIVARRLPGLSIILALAVYGVLAGALLGRQSLWLDEIIDLQQIRDLDFQSLMKSIPFNAGGVPLSYLIRDVFIKVLGYSAFAGRLPSLLFSLVALAGVYRLAVYLKLRWPLLPVAILALMPVQLRYAMESRPYSQVLAVTVWSTVVFLDMQERPTNFKYISYTLLNIAGLYTQPFSIFVPVAHLLWAWLSDGLKSARTWALAGCLAGCALAFYPWYRLALGLWQHSEAGKQLYPVTFHSSAMLLKEFSGAGYAGTIALLLLCIPGFRGKSRFWSLYIFLPLLLPVFADWYFGYFLATRQTIAAAAPVALIAAHGVESLRSRWNSKFAYGACVLLFSILLAADVRFLTKPREDWQAAARYLRSASSRSTCIDFTPPESSVLFTFFDSGLTDLRCGSNQSNTSILVARSPYDSQEAHRAEARRLRERGYTLRREVSFNGPTVEIYR